MSLTHICGNICSTDVQGGDKILQSEQDWFLFGQHQSGVACDLLDYMKIAQEDPLESIYQIEPDMEDDEEELMRSCRRDFELPWEKEPGQ